jgi:Orsellinic acid/F9775 biosynthesis cluster protein D
MALLEFDPVHGVLACTRCHYAIPRDFIVSHLREYHRQDVAPADRQAYAESFDALPIRPPREVARFQPPPYAPPIPYLTLYKNGICCKLCDNGRPYIVRSKPTMVQHLKNAHGWRRWIGKQWPSNPKLEDVTWYPIACQTFHRGTFFRFFAVYTGVMPSNATASLPPSSYRPSGQIPRLSLRERVEQQLTQKLEANNATLAQDLLSRHATEVSHWLDLTQWSQYFKGHSLSDAMALVDLPPHGNRIGSNLPVTGLSLLLDSSDRLIEQARESLRHEKINIFDQHYVNNFLGWRRITRPLLYKLRPGTYSKYKRIWKQLLCFVYRLACQEQGPRLQYTLTEAQSEALSCITDAITAAEGHQDGAGHIPAQYLQRLDSACLQLCIALLDHPLHNSIYDSIVLGFLAVLGIRRYEVGDEERIGFCEPTNYTPKLSAFVKCAQLIVVQRTVVAVEQKEVSKPADILEVMYERFMLYGTHSPMNWAQKLRAYGKKIQDSTTSLGYIVWSDDGEEIEYKGLKLSMTGLRRFLSTQVQEANRQLQELLFVPATEWQYTVPAVDLSQLRDNPANDQPGWSFLKDPRNVSLQGHDRWLLNRVLDQDTLRKRFLTNQRDAKWRRQAAKEYLQKVDAFLERMLLLIHITGGQPARGTELLSIQCCNTRHGFRRNIFMENGLIGFVTFYHKGYSVSGSTKVIHRYLPENISALLVYYRWLVQPFCQQLCLLALDQKVEPPSFLWARMTKSGVEPWTSARLTNVLREQFKGSLDTEAAILLWRHTAIAISRRHLRYASFNKDYGIETSPTIHDSQSAHTGILAGNVYARSLEEAPGHVASARAEFRQISREWHVFLGIAGPEQCLNRGVVSLGSGVQRQRVAIDRLPSVQRPATSSLPPVQRPATGPLAFTQRPAAESPQAPPLRLQKFAPEPVPKNQPSASLMICMNPSQRALYLSRIKEVHDDKLLLPCEETALPGENSMPLAHNPTAKGRHTDITPQHKQLQQRISTSGDNRKSHSSVPGTNSMSKARHLAKRQQRDAKAALIQDGLSCSLSNTRSRVGKGPAAERRRKSTESSSIWEDGISLSPDYLVKQSQLELQPQADYRLPLQELSNQPNSIPLEIHHIRVFLVGWVAYAHPYRITA